MHASLTAATRTTRAAGARADWRDALRLLAGALVLALAAVHDGARADDLARGRQMAERLCATCHMNPGQGEKAGPAGIPGFAAVARRPGQTLDGIVAWLKSVPPMMPNHHLTQDEMSALALYILSLAKTAPPAPEGRR